jgi:hypothetical protein
VPPGPERARAGQKFRDHPGEAPQNTEEGQSRRPADQDGTNDVIGDDHNQHAESEIAKFSGSLWIEEGDFGAIADIQVARDPTVPSTCDMQFRCKIDPDAIGEVILLGQLVDRL